MKRLLVLLICLIAGLTMALAACRVIWTPLRADLLPDERISVDGMERRYRLVLPRSLPRPAPVVFAFHGIGDAEGGRSGETMAGYSGLDRLAAENGFLLVYPAARHAAWAVMDADAENLDANPDVRFFDQLLQAIAKQYDIDSQRVYLIGFSKGATFVQLLAQARSERIAAVVAHSGSKPRETVKGVRPYAIMLIVGEEDLADAVRLQADEYRAAGHPTAFIAVPGLGHEWSRRHNQRMWEFLAGHALFDARER